MCPSSTPLSFICWTDRLVHRHRAITFNCPQKTKNKHVLNIKHECKIRTLKAKFHNTCSLHCINKQKSQHLWAILTETILSHAYFLYLQLDKTELKFKWTKICLFFVIVSIKVALYIQASHVHICFSITT